MSSSSVLRLGESPHILNVLLVSKSRAFAWKTTGSNLVESLSVSIGIFTPEEELSRT